MSVHHSFMHANKESMYQEITLITHKKTTTLSSSLIEIF